MSTLHEKQLSDNNIEVEEAYESSQDICNSKLYLTNLDENSPKEQPNENVQNESLESWFVLLSVLIFHIILGYHLIAFGIYYVAFTETFESTKATAGFINSIAGGSFAGLSIFGSALIELFGIRKVAVSGSLLLFIGVFTSAFATNIYTLYITYGLIGGCGGSFALLTPLVLIQEHFHKHRSLATPTAMLSMPLGYALSPLINNFFLDMYGWRGTLMMHSGLVLHTVPVAMTFWPVKGQQTIKVKPSWKNFGRSICNSFSVLKMKSVIIFTVAIVLMRINIISFFDHTPSRMFHLGYSLAYAGYGLTVIFGAVLISRIVYSIIMGFTVLDPLVGLEVSAFIHALVSLLCPLFDYYLPIIILCGCFGAAEGVLSPTILLAIVKTGGVANFAKIRAVFNIFGGLGNMVATPFSGWLFDITQNYDIPFYVCGSVGMVAFFCTILVHITHKLELQRKTKSEVKEDNTKQKHQIKTAKC